MSKNTIENLEALRAEMRRAHVDAVIVPGTDAHQSEYLCDHWKIRDWLTGFTGSNGTAVVTLDDARLWTDSRYFLQAEQELEGSGFTMMKEDIPGEPTMYQWLAANLEEGIIGLDGTLFSVNQVARLENFCGENGLQLAPDFAPFDRIWHDRPERPQGKLFVHDVKYAGESVASKLERTMEQVENAGAEAIFIAALDEIAWLFNLRCDDIKFTPEFISFAYVSSDERVLFVDDAKLTDDVRAALKADGITTRPYESTRQYVHDIDLGTSVLVDPVTVSDTLAQAMMCVKIWGRSPIQALKAVKNDTQQAGIREAMKRDGVALVRTFKWVEENAANGITEDDVWTRAKADRAKAGDIYRGDSFDMIAGYRDHGAIVHYSATPESNATLKPEGLLLVDTGAQYLDGTTDITRTMTLGNPTDEERHDYTLVLRGHLCLAMQPFPIGTRGAQLDALARQYMWREGITYYHGTGHGVGHFLAVHEGPQNIRLNENPTPLVPGMVQSDEPGIYKAGRHGIRIENLTLVVEDKELSSDEFGTFYRFETLTLCPYDARLIDTAMLTDAEIEWINAYHRRVYDTLAPELDPDTAAWLAEKTRPLTR